TTIDDFDGRPMAAVVHDAALRDEPDLLAEVVVTARLALQRDRGMQALRRSEARMRGLFDALPDLMIRFTRDGRYVDIRGDTSGLVRPRDKLLGRNVREFLPPELVECILASATAALESGSIHSVEYELEVGGEVRYFEARMVPGSGDELVSIVRDFTDQRR